ncbi:gluconokinase [Camelliibacillus cellulosilyticus]|uniref:Gluconokinase n=1 Tax=Camelliibacillus cellulosilyticus TaxID=2174486 RepID=A0ABV9GMU4_9BACL
MGNYIVGVDIGTTSTKALLYKENGEVVADHHIRYPLETPNPGTAEQDPEQIFAAVVETIQKVVKGSGVQPAEVSCVSFSSAMHSVIAMDRSGTPLTKCITWADGRSAKWTEKIKSEWNGHEIYMRTGTPLHPMAPLSKLVWLRREHPDIFMVAAKFISIKEYVFYRLFGRYLIDYSMASGTGLFNLNELTWDMEALQVAGVSPEQLSEPVPTTFQVSGLRVNDARQLALLTETPFIVGASDGMLSNLGMGAIDPGVIAVTIGTSAAVRTVVDRPIADPEGRIFCYALTENHWVIGGASNNGGLILQWAVDQFGQAEKAKAQEEKRDPFDVFAETAQLAAPGSEGLLFFPYLTGERAPLWNAEAKGSYVGLRLQHGREQIIRSTFEGIIFNLYAIIEVVEKLTGKTHKIHATGGFARSPFWRQMLADIFDKEVIVPENYESSCLGAMVLGLYSLGKIDSLSAVNTMIGRSRHHLPNKEAARRYHRIKPHYLRLAQSITKDSEALARL